MLISTAKRCLMMEQRVPSQISCFHTFVIVYMAKTAQEATKCSPQMVMSDKYRRPLLDNAWPLIRNYNIMCPLKRYLFTDAVACTQMTSPRVVPFLLSGSQGSLSSSTHDDTGGFDVIKRLSPPAREWCRLIGYHICRRSYSQMKPYRAHRGL